MFLFILFFIAYSVAVFVVPSTWIYVLVGFTALNILLLIVLKISPIKLLKNLFRIFWFALIVFLFNLIFDSVISSLIVVWRIVIVCNFAFIFSKAMSPANMALGFSQLFAPLKIFKVNTNDFALMFVIAFNFIDIFAEESKVMKRSLKARGFKFNLKNLLSKSHVILLMFFAGIFKRADSLEASLKARGYGKCD